MLWKRSGAWVVAACTLAFALSPVWVPDFGGFDPQAFPIPQDRPPVQPAGYAFAIWGVIFLWLGLSAVIGLRRPEWGPMRAPLALSLAVGAVWLPVATLSPIWATVLIWAMLLPALLATARAEAGWAASWPVGLYAGWLSAASCVAIGLLLAGYGLMAQESAAYAMIAVATVLVCFMQWRFVHSPTYGVAAIWALLAITVQNGLPSGVGMTAAVGAALIALPTARSWAGILK